ncbi:YkgJ family cysteine cluster protein [Vibrio parahaemolyticus]|nr:YkgJ family cysteine cluster protein [Vibrio parahaemolyticus]
MNESRLVKDRSCGKCSACCVELKIDDAALKKQADEPCPHLIPTGGCGIYNERPSVCRTWYCAWRFMGQFGDELRPDLSGVILRFDESGGLIFQPVRDAEDVLTSELILSVIGGGIASDLPVFISVPTRTGYCSSKVQANEALKSRVLSRDFDATKSAMIQLINFAKSQPTDPIN